MKREGDRNGESSVRVHKEEDGEEGNKTKRYEGTKKSNQDERQ